MNDRPVSATIESMKAHSAQPRVRPTRRRRASPRVLLGALGGLAVTITAVGLVAALTRHSSPATPLVRFGTLSNALPGAREVNRMLGSVPQDGNTLGRRSAPVTLVEYVDLQCPYCRDFETQALPQLVARYVRSGALKVEVRSIAFIGPDSERGRDAVIAAGQQDRMFDFLELLYLNQRVENSGWLDDRMVEAAAESIPGLDVSRLLHDRGTAATMDEAHELDRLAQDQRVTSTPTILVGRSGGVLQQVELTSPTDSGSVAAAVESALR